MPIAMLTDPDELLHNGGDEIYEFVGGRIQELEMGAEAEFISFIIARILANFVDDNKLGFVFNSKTPYRCFPHDPKMVRYPDCSFIAKGRLPNSVIPKGFITIPPDLAIEVVSPHDDAELLEKKIDDYFRAGVKLVWIVYPETRNLMIRRPDHSAQVIPPDGTVTGEAVVPGFLTAIADFFLKT